jgi:two-component system chemotaxis response regulator CheY
MNAKSWLNFRNNSGNILTSLFSRHEKIQLQLPGQALTSKAVNPCGKKILLVDDDLVILKTTSFKLKAAGYEVITSSDCSDAIRAVREENPDMILLDIVYPPDIAHGGGVPWDGFLLMNWMRSVLHATSVPVIFITGSDSAELRDRALAMGATGIFVKPLHHARLVEFIDRILKPQNDSAGPPAEESFQI